MAVANLPLFPLALVLLLFPVAAIIVFVVEAAVSVILYRLQHRLFGGLALCGFILALAPVILPRIEDQVQPWQHLLDRRQLARRTGFTTRAGFAPCSGLALRSGFATLALWTGFARRTGLARRPGLAARTLEPESAGMALRSRTSRFARTSARPLRPLSSRPARAVICHRPHSH